MILIHDETGTVQRRAVLRSATAARRSIAPFSAAGVEILLLNGVVRFIRRSWPRYGRPAPPRSASPPERHCRGRDNRGEQSAPRLRAAEHAEGAPRDGSVEDVISERILLRWFTDEPGRADADARSAGGGRGRRDQSRGAGARARGGGEEGRTEAGAGEGVLRRVLGSFLAK